jgi:hypothetical protein
MNFGEQLARIRNKLRDPEGKIWARSLIVDTFNDCQKEIQVKTKFIEDIDVIEIPPLYDISYMHDWEWRHFPEGIDRAYRSLRYSEQGGFTFCHRFESEMYFGRNNDLADEGTHFVFPWEGMMADTPGEVIRFKFPSDFHSTIYIAYDRKPLDFEHKKTIQMSDQGYVNTDGEPYCYYREDDLDNEFVLYPKPQANFDDETNITHVYTHSWEAGLLSGEGEMFGVLDSVNSRTYIYLWELGFTGQADVGIRSMFESEEGSLAQYAAGDSSDVFGAISFREGDLLSQETGFSTDILDDDGNVILIYSGIGRDVSLDADESNLPKFLRKYIEYGVLEQCYGSNNDGRIQSLAEYWRYRYLTGIQMIKKFMIVRKQDRNYRMISSDRATNRNQRHPRLPSNYPAI